MDKKKWKRKNGKEKMEKKRGQRKNKLQNLHIYFFGNFHILSKAS